MLSTKNASWCDILQFCRHSGHSLICYHPVVGWPINLMGKKINKKSKKIITRNKYLHGSRQERKKENELKFYTTSIQSNSSSSVVERSKHFRSILGQAWFLARNLSSLSCFLSSLPVTMLLWWALDRQRVVHSIQSKLIGKPLYVRKNSKTS